MEISDFVQATYFPVCVKTSDRGLHTFFEYIIRHEYIITDCEFAREQDRIISVKMHFVLWGDCLQNQQISRRTYKANTTPLMPKDPHANDLSQYTRQTTSTRGLLIILQGINPGELNILIDGNVELPVSIFEFHYFYIIIVRIQMYKQQLYFDSPL